MRRRHNQRCGCNKPVKEVVHPVKKNVVHQCTEEVVKHVHPSHTTIMNHHLVKNEHVYPHSTSVANAYDEVDVSQPPNMGPGSQVAGTMDPGMDCQGPAWNKGKKHRPKRRY